MFVRHYEASSTVDTSFVFECGACGYAGMADVTGEGFAEADTGSALFADNSAEGRALDDAEGKAWNDALTTVELAPCPKCGRTDKGRWKAWLGSQVVGVVAWGALGAFLTLLGTFLLRQQMDATPLLMGAVAWPLVSGTILGTRVRRKKVRAQLLRFH